MTQYPNLTNQNRKSATFAHLMFLTNLTVLPVFSFIWLLFVYQKVKNDADSDLLRHYRQSIVANIIAGILLVLVSGFILFLGSLESAYTWMWLILYFTCIHSVLILFAVFGLMKANAEKPYTYPLFGKLWN